MSARVKPNVVTFWHGAPLHELHRMCLASQAKLGYRVTLYSYEPLQGLPRGIENEDAAPILPLSFLDRLPTLARGRGTNRPLLHLSDLFRIRLQRLGTAFGSTPTSISSGRSTSTRSNRSSPGRARTSSAMRSSISRQRIRSSRTTSGSSPPTRCCPIGCRCACARAGAGGALLAARMGRRISAP